MERIEALRSRALNGNCYGNEFYFRFYKVYGELENVDEWERYGEAFYRAFASLTPCIHEGELIVGSRDTVLSPAEEKLWQEKYRPICEQRCATVPGQGSHMAIDYETLLSMGCEGVIDRICELMKTAKGERLAFYKTCIRCLEGVIAHSENYAAEAVRQSLYTADPARKKELEEIAAICRRVPAKPARTFHEALQSVHFMTHCISLNPLRPKPQQFQLGHPDRYLLRFYENDMRNGTLTRGHAQLLMDLLGIQINMRVPNGLSSGYMLGGRDADGNIVANDITEMGLKVIEDIRLVYPSVGFCHTEGMPEKYLDMACALLAQGCSHPALFNDDVIVRGLMSYGVPECEARDYIHSTCVEITPTASSNVWVASPYTNMPQLLLDAMDREYPDLNAFIENILKRLDARIRENYAIQNGYRMMRAKYSMNPIVSCFVNDCIGRGLDIERGGAKYNWIMPSFVGMANLVDSLYAVNRLVFEDRSLTMKEFHRILADNYNDQESLKLFISNRIPKYGNDVDDVDRYFGLFTEHIIAECAKYECMHENGRLIPSVFCWTMHERFGRETGATPDGRRAGFPLGDGSGPCQGREMHGPTASVLSTTKWDHHRMIGGVAVNLRFSKANLGPDSVLSMKAIAKAYMERGGFEMQINVVDNDVLRRARKNPDQYRDLVVRIGGYSDYFVKLSPEMQDEIMLRTVHHV